MYDMVNDICFNAIKIKSHNNRCPSDNSREKGCCNCVEGGEFADDPDRTKTLIRNTFQRASPFFDV